MSFYHGPVAVCRVELNKYNNTVRRALDNTVRKYREACIEILPAVKEHWAEICLYNSDMDKMRYVETLIHRTKDNPNPEYPLFDLRLYKFPSYYRRSAINFVLGAYSSYMSNLKNYEERRYEAISSGKRFKEQPPRLESLNKFPALYKKECFSRLSDGSIKIKVYIRNTWDWITANIPNRDKKDLTKRLSEGKALNPSLVYAYGKYHLDFPVEYKSKLTELPDLKFRRILAVDMGINNDAVCSVIRGDGTIESRHFINLASEKDRLNRLINRTKKLQRMSGKGQSLSHVYTKLDGVKDNHAKQLASRIRKLAVERGVDVVVLEHLDKMKAKGSKKDRIHHWCKKRMQDILCGQLHRYGIRYAFVNPANTSALAYNGSGKVKRNGKNFSICKFSTGKVYNCDLNASYNIGARYFIRECIKPFDESQKLRLQAKVPEAAKRTDCTYSTYLKILAA